MLGCALVAAVFAAYWGVSDHAFIHYDDPLYVTENGYLYKGLSRDGILWAFTTLYANFWHPLTWLSYLLDVALFGMNAGGMLFTNLMLHVFSTLVLFAALRRMTGAAWRSALVAALFALHPLNVESVAWVAERKNVLSTLFWMLTMWGYCRYAQQPGRWRLALTLSFFILGLMAKPMLVTLPFVLLLMDYWPLGRWVLFPASATGSPVGTRLPACPLDRLILEKMPFFLIAAGFSALAYVAQEWGGALPSLDACPLPVRAANALVSYAVYLRKMIWPFDLTLFYPHPGMPSMGRMALAMVVVVFISWVAVRRIRSQPWFIVGWLWYLGTLVPVIGLVQIGIFAMADRFAYIPLIGVFIMAAWAGAGDTGRPYRQKALTLGWVLILVVMVGVTRHQVRYWENTTTLFRHALAVAGPNALYYELLGAALADNGETDAAIRHYRKALELNPNNGETLSNLGAALADQGSMAAAADRLQAALHIDPSLKKAHNNLGNLMARQGRLDEAIAHYRRALEIDPVMATAINNLGVALARQGNVDAAVALFERALQIKPDYASAQKNLAIYSAARNRNGDSKPHVRQ